MDEIPFFTVDLLDLKDAQIKELAKLHKSNFDTGKLFSSAEELKYTDQIKRFMQQQMTEPDDDFIAAVMNRACGKYKYKSNIDKFRPIVKKSLAQFSDELVDERLDVARNISKEKIVSEEPKEKEEVPVEENVEKPQRSVVTTQEELEAYAIIKVLLREMLPPEKISYKDNLSYFAVLYDNNTWKWICRLDVEGNKKWLIVPNEKKESIYYPLENINDLFNYVEVIKSSAARFVEK